MRTKRGEGLSARTVQYHHAVLRRSLQDAERNGLVPRNVAKLVTPPTVSRPEIRPWTPQEGRAFLAAAKGHRLETAFAIAMATGVRQGELLGLRWSDIDWGRSALSVSKSLQRYHGQYHLEETKTRRSVRTIPLPERLLDDIREHQRVQVAERVFAGNSWRGDEWGLVFATLRGNH